MTIVTKNIRGRAYLYFQDSIKTDDTNKIVTTLISRADAEGQKLLQSKQEAFGKHFIKILKITSTIGTKQYGFETFGSDDSETMNDALDYFRLMNDIYGKVLSASEWDDFKNMLFTKYVHSTTAIEGNTLSEDETFKLLSADLTPQNKTVNETLEVSNYKYVKEFLKSQSGNVTEKMIKRIHQLLMNGIRAENGKLIKAGEYRDSQAILRGIGFRPPPAEAVPSQMKYLLEEYNSKIQENIHPIEIAVIFHQKFEEIHPFQDGNGRVGREILNYMLTQNGFPPIYLPLRERSDYLTALQEGNRREHLPLFLLIFARLGGTLEYLMSRTSIFSIISSETSREIAKEIGAEDIYNKHLEILSKHRSSNELP